MINHSPGKIVPLQSHRTACLQGVDLWFSESEPNLTSCRHAPSKYTVRIRAAHNPTS